MRPPVYVLVKEPIVIALDAHHLTHADFARQLGISRSHWSQLFNGHRRATPRVRRALLRHPCLRGISEDALWERITALPELPAATDPTVG
jgi:transcriptional regulator with XRE-family HTH domain